MRRPWMVRTTILTVSLRLRPTRRRLMPTRLRVTFMRRPLAMTRTVRLGTRSARRRPRTHLRGFAGEEPGG